MSIFKFTYCKQTEMMQQVAEDKGVWQQLGCSMSNKSQCNVHIGNLIGFWFFC